jgi:glucose-1-phosphate thymidylyltransferase
MMKGIVLAGGSGSRLHPVTRAVSKQLLPVYDKPMVYYPLSVLMLAGIREVLLISTPEDLPLFRRLLGDGSQCGISISYAPQPRPEGLAQAFLIGKSFLRDQGCCMILGDNIFYGQGLSRLFAESARLTSGAQIFGYRVQEPSRYGVVETDSDGNAIGLEEKPANPRSHWAVPGIYFYDRTVCDRAAQLTPSQRGELEITDLNRSYMAQGQLRVRLLGRGVAWLDTGTNRSFLQANNFVEAIQVRQGVQIACLEEIAYENRWIDLEQLERTAGTMGSSEYAAYLRSLIARERDRATP